MPSPQPLIHHLGNRPPLINQIVARNSRLGIAQPFAGPLGVVHAGIVQKKHVWPLIIAARPNIRRKHKPGGEPRSNHDGRSFRIFS